MLALDHLEKPKILTLETLESLPTLFPAHSTRLIKSRLQGDITSFQQTPDGLQHNVISRIIGDDFHLFAELNLKVVNKDKNLVPFIPNPPQEVLLQLLLGDLKKGVPLRYLIVKARQLGMSTLIQAFYYWLTVTNTNYKTGIISHDDESARSIFEMYRNFYDESLPAFQPDAGYDSKEGMTFSLRGAARTQRQKHVAICELPADLCPVSHDLRGLKSSIKPSVAGQDKGRGQTPNLLHLSEVSSYRMAAKLIAGLMQGVPLKPNTAIILESTAKAPGDYFHKEFLDSVSGEGNFRPIFFGWHMMPEYELPHKGVRKLTGEETKLLKLFEKKGYNSSRSLNKIAFHRQKRREFRQSDDPDEFYREYPSTAKEAFKFAGKIRFNRNIVDKNLKVATATDYKTMTLSDTSIEDDEHGKLKVWQEPDEDLKYVIAVDVATGAISPDNKNPDYTVAEVGCARNQLYKNDNRIETVARYRLRIDPDLVGQRLLTLARWYNDPLIVVEANNNGITVISDLRRANYANLYRPNRDQLDPSLASGYVSTAHFGWHTTKGNKNTMVNTVNQAMLSGAIIDYDYDFWYEAAHFTVDDKGLPGAQPGHHDDTIIAKAILLQVTGFGGVNDGTDDSQSAKREALSRQELHYQRARTATSGQRTSQTAYRQRQTGFNRAF